MTVINTNTGSLYAQQALNTNARALASVTQQLSTGSRALTNTRRAFRPLVCCGDNVNSSRTPPSSLSTLAIVSAAISFARSPARKLNSTIALSRAACLRVAQWASTCLSCLSVSVLACFICAPAMSCCCVRYNIF